jgi:hypothetical protein
MLKNMRHLRRFTSGSLNTPPMLRSCMAKIRITAGSGARRLTLFQKYTSVCHGDDYIDLGWSEVSEHLATVRTQVAKRRRSASRSVMDISKFPRAFTRFKPAVKVYLFRDLHPF